MEMKLNRLAFIPALLALAAILSCEGRDGPDKGALLLPLLMNRHGTTGVITPAEVVDYSPENETEFAYTNPALALGFPRGAGQNSGSLHVVSLGFDGSGAGGSITLRFNNKIINGSGVDFKIYENVFTTGSSYTYIEAATVELSLNGTDWYAFPTIFNGDPLISTDAANPANYVQGYAGVNPVITDYDDPSSPRPEDADSGGDFFDLENMTEPIKSSGFYYIRITDAGQTVNDPGNVDDIPADGIPDFGWSGFDLDAVTGINYE